MPKGKGNRNPSPATRFGAGQKGNPIGKTGLQREMEILNAQKATQIRARLLDALDLTLQDATPETILARIEANVLKLIKDSEERGLGSPQASTAVQVTNPDGSLKQATARDIALELLSATHGKPVTV
jgi:hypothetical protein